MNRVSSTILVASGIALLATQLISPAGSAPRSPSASPEPIADVQDPTLETMRAEVNRLRERTRQEPAADAPARDPFNFGRAPERPRPAVAATAAPVPELRPVMLPQLVAVVVNGGAENVVRTAVFTAGDSIDLINAGESIGAFRVESITAEGVVLVHRDAGTSYTVRLH